jgi:predicted transcriptional regulator
MLIYCTKARPYLVKGFARAMHGLDFTDPKNFTWFAIPKKMNSCLNGKVVAECDFTVEQIDNLGVCPSMYQEELLALSCLTNEELCKYLNKKNGFAFHIKNIHTFEPNSKRLEDYCYKTFRKTKVNFFGKEVDAVTCIMDSIKVAPQSMQYVYDCKTKEKYLLVSMKPQWVQKFLNGEKTIEVRKRILKGLI